MGCEQTASFTGPGIGGTCGEWLEATTVQTVERSMQLNTRLSPVFPQWNAPSQFPRVPPGTAWYSSQPYMKHSRMAAARIPPCWMQKAGCIGLYNFTGLMLLPQSYKSVANRLKLRHHGNGETAGWLIFGLHLWKLNHYYTVVNGNFVTAKVYNGITSLLLYCSLY